MADFGVIVGLDVTSSAQEIKNDIRDKLKPTLDSDTSARLKLIAQIDPEKTYSAIKAQLGEISSSLSSAKINLSIDTVALQGDIKTTVARVSEDINKGVVIKPTVDVNSLNNALNPLIQKNNEISNTTNQLELFKQSLTNIGMSSDKVEAVANRINSLKVEITSLNQSLSKTTGENGKRLLSVDIAGIDKLGQAVKLTQQYNFATGELIKSIDTVSSATQKSSSQLDNLMAQQIKRKADLQNQVEQIYKSAVDPNASRSITNDTHLNNLASQYNKIKIAIADIGSTSKTTFAEQEVNIKNLISQLKIAVLEYQRAENVSTTLKPDKLASAISKAESRFQALNVNIQNAGVNSDKLTQNIQTIKSVLDKPQNGGVINKAEIEQVFTALSNARNELSSLIKMKTADSSIEKVRIQAETLLNNLDTFARNNKGFDGFTSTINGTVVSVQSLKQALSNINSQSDLSIIRSQVDALKSSFKTSTEDASKYVTQIEKTIAKTNSLQNSSVFAKNTSNPKVIQIKQELANLATEYQNLMTKLQGNITPASLELLKTELVGLDTRFKQTQTSAKNFEAALKNSKDAENLSTKIRVLTNQIIAFKNANSKAMNSSKLSSNGMTFANEIDNMLAKLKQGADPAVYNQIANNFKVIKNEITALGLNGSGFIGQLWANMKKFASWMGMTTAMTNFAMYIRRSITELKDIDTILTEISKTSDRTSESLRKLGKEAFDAASQFGRTVSDYLTGIQEMSRAGFNENKSEQMANLSILAQSAGDMTAELGNSYLIATNAAYKFEGDVEKLNSVLDSQNYITNRNALNMTELAKATEIAASQAAQAGIGIDEATAAMGTMIATTQQGGEIAARAFKGIIMNLQQVKATAEEIGDGGEDITDESLTKYEKAANDLGVALKEVRNGVYVLRDPMKILDDLAKAFNTEADNSIKKANLINAIGGKYRGNQLSALLSNWATYKKMLSEFNSSEAQGSAFEEAMKTADSWEGRLNTLSNTWTKFVNNFVDSDLAKWATTTLTDLIKIIDEITKSFGAIPTLVGAIVGSTMAFKNVGELLNTPSYALLQLCA